MPPPASAPRAARSTGSATAIDAPASSITDEASTRSPVASDGSSAPDSPQLRISRGFSAAITWAAPPPTPTAIPIARVWPSRPRTASRRSLAPNTSATLRSSIGSAVSTSTGRSSHSPQIEVSLGSSAPLRRSQIRWALAALSSPVSSTAAISSIATRIRRVADSSNSSTCVGVRS